LNSFNENKAVISRKAKCVPRHPSEREVIFQRIPFYQILSQILLRAQAWQVKPSDQAFPVTFVYANVTKNELSALRADFSDRINRIYMILIYPDYPVDPVQKMEIPILCT